MNARISFLFAAIAISIAAMAFNGASATPPLDYGISGICPSTYGHSAAGSPQMGGTGNATDCNEFITFSSNGAIATTFGPQVDYESNDDALIGVINNSTHTIYSFTLTETGTDIFGFDGDGIDVYTLCGGTDGTGANLGKFTGATNCNLTSDVGDTTSYGGLYATYSSIDAAKDSGTVNFVDGIAPGTTAFFSLEEPATLTANPVIGPINGGGAAPEPASLSLLGVGLAGLSLLRRGRSKS